MLIIENILEFFDSEKLKNKILEFLDESLMCMFFYLIMVILNYLFLFSIDKILL